MPVTFGLFTADFEARELRRAGKSVHLSPKAFQLLATLIRERPRALSKADLQEVLWPDVFVAESNLADLVSELRRAFGQRGRRIGFIRTVHAFGYAFSGEAQDDSSSPAVPASTPSWLVGWDKGCAELGAGEFLIGRDTRAAIRLAPSTVSWQHARLHVHGSGPQSKLSIDDLESRNGTFVNDERVRGTAELKDGDDVRLGSVHLSVRRLDSERRSTDPM
jgi:DNA-binding winged helix-turn-helix (wHTH) protein